MRIVSLTAQNVKKLRAVEITPNGALVQITGPNGSGKSSVLDAIFMALAGSKAIPSKPVRKGADKALIKLDLGDIVVTRRFTAAGGTSLIVEAADGARYPSPQKMLDDLLGALTFDPLAFSRMDPKQQLEQIRALVPLEVDIDELDRLNTADFLARTDVNRRAKTLRAQAEAIAVDPDAPTAPVDVAELSAAMQQASEHNADLERRKANRDKAAATIADTRGNAQRWREQARALRQQANQLEHDADEASQRADELQGKVDAAGELPAPIDVAEIRAQIDQAAAINRGVQARQDREQRNSEAEAAERNAAALTAAIDARKAQREDAIAKAPMPVDGMTLGEDGLLFNGLPFDQASSAEQLRVSVAIAMAANPKLRVLRIKDGSLLDESGLRLVGEMAQDADYQVWIEQVDTSGKVGIVMEDGAVRGFQAAEEIHAEEAIA